MGNEWVSASMRKEQVLAWGSVGKESGCLWWEDAGVWAGVSGRAGVEGEMSVGLLVGKKGCPWGCRCRPAGVGAAPLGPPAAALHRSAAHPTPSRPPYKPAGPAAGTLSRPCCTARRDPVPTRRPPKPPSTSKRSSPGSRRDVVPPPLPPPRHPRAGPRRHRAPERGWDRDRDRCWAAGAGAGAAPWPGGAVQVSGGVCAEGSRPARVVGGAWERVRRMGRERGCRGRGWSAGGGSGDLPAGRLGGMTRAGK